MENTFFFDHYDLDKSALTSLVAETLADVDDGELYLQYSQSEGITVDDGRVKSSSFDTSQGFGLRAVCGEATGYAHSNVLTPESIRKAGKTVQAVRAGHEGKLDISPSKPTHSLYTEKNPLGDFGFEEKVALLQQIDRYARAKSNQVQQVTVGLGGEWDVVTIIRPDGYVVSDFRPLIRFRLSLVTNDGTVQESDYFGKAGRYGYAHFFEEENWKSYVDETLRIAILKLSSKPAPAGVMPVVLGSGDPGVLLHEAVGHGLEGDFNRKKTSAFAGLLGQQVAAKGVTVVDDGTIEEGMGSLNMDDEGTPTRRNVLIEDGILTGYMQDRLNARLMGMAPTGNGRRESFAHAPMPRMTNTFMMGGNCKREELFEGIKKGLYAVSFGGGQVDITSGKYVFSATEAYMIEDGKITYPVKGATLIGDGPADLKKITKIADDLALDPGSGYCGKGGQAVPVHVGQPSILIDGMTVGGTET